MAEGCYWWLRWVALLEDGEIPYVHVRDVHDVLERNVPAVPELVVR